MVNFSDLKIPSLKKEREARGLSVTGQKADLQKHEILRLDKCVRELQLNGLVTSIGITKLKTPTLDGTVPFKISKLQFETTASTNHWRNDDKVAALVVSLKGSAAEC
ncbi:hypothetical protein CBL_01791 [Carabus blaptoides fortunei]